MPTQAFAARWNAQRVCAPADLAAAGLDLVVVATPDAAHAADLRACWPARVRRAWS
jgi:predicted dehydrogenase